MRILRQSRAPAGICGLLILLLVCAGCGNSTVQPITSRTQASTPPIAGTAPITPLPITGSQPPTASGPLGPAPTTCPASPHLQTMTQDHFGGGFSSPISFQGGSFVWQLGLPTDGSPIQLHQDNVHSYSSTKVMWVVGPNYAQVVTLSGHEVHTGAPLWFEIYPSNSQPISSSTPSTYYTQAPLDPAAPNRGSTDNSTGHWNIWGIGLIALTAGCYELDATWSGGGWQAIYAIGG